MSFFGAASVAVLFFDVVLVLTVLLAVPLCFAFLASKSSLFASLFERFLAAASFCCEALSCAASFCAASFEIFPRLGLTLLLEVVFEILSDFRSAPLCFVLLASKFSLFALLRFLLLISEFSLSTPLCSIDLWSVAVSAFIKAFKFAEALKFSSASELELILTLGILSAWMLEISSVLAARILSAWALDISLLLSLEILSASLLSGSFEISLVSSPSVALEILSVLASASLSSQVRKFAPLPRFSARSFLMPYPSPARSFKFTPTASLMLLKPSARRSSANPSLIALATNGPLKIKAVKIWTRLAPDLMRS